MIDTLACGTPGLPKMLNAGNYVLEEGKLAPEHRPGDVDSAVTPDLLALLHPVYALLLLLWRHTVVLPHRLDRGP
jgi:hypothetical protein